MGVHHTLTECPRQIDRGPLRQFPVGQRPDDTVVVPPVPLTGRVGLRPDRI